MTNQPKIRIMLVEDNQEYRSVLQKVLQQTEGMELVSINGTAERALSFLRSNPKTVDLLLLDLQLPGISGIEAMHRFFESAPDIRQIILTQSDKEEDLLKTISQGASGYLLKTSTIEEIIQSIEAVAAGGASIHPAMAKFLLDSFKVNQCSIDSDTDLTERELEVLSLVADGFVKKEIAQKLNVSFFTIAAHIRNIYDKLEVVNAPQAVKAAYRKNLLQ